MQQTFWRNPLLFLAFSLFIWFAVTDSISEKLELGGIGGLADTDNKNKIFLVLPYRHKSWTLQHADRNSD